MEDQKRDKTLIAYKCKVGLAMNSEKAYKAFRELLLQKLREKKAKRGEMKALAEKLGVKPSTVGRWAELERGQDMTLENALKLAEGLGIPMEDVLRVMLPDDAEDVIALFEHDEQTMRKLLKIALSDQNGWELIKGQIDYIASRIDSKSSKP